MASRQEQGQPASFGEVQRYVYYSTTPCYVYLSLLTKFSECSQAYEILSDPEKRKIYDQYGLEFLLRGGVPQEDAGGPGGNPFAGAGGPGGFPFTSSGGMPGGTRTFHFSTGGGGNGFNFSNADDIFGEFMRNTAGGGGDDFDFGGFGMGGMPGGMGGMGGK